MIEVILYNYLKEKLNVAVFALRKGKMPKKFVLFERISGTNKNHICGCTIALQSYATNTLLEAIELNEEVKKAMASFASIPTIASCELENDYNFTDTTTKQYRYQAVFHIVYY